MSSPRPDTYFLQRAVNLGLSAIAGRLDPAENYRPFFGLIVNDNPRLEHSIWDLGDMVSRYVDGFILGRQITGCDKYREQEESLRRMLPDCDSYAEPFMATRKLITYVDLYLQNPSRETKKSVEELIKLIRSRMTIEGDYAYYLKREAGWRSLDQPLGNFTPYPTYPIGGIVLALARFLESTNSPEAEDLALRLCRFITQVSGTFESDGRYKGHTHSGGILTSIAGCLRLATLTGDKKTIELMHNAFDWTLQHCSSWGWVPDGLGSEGNEASSETCSITDAINAACVLGEHINPRYFGWVERTARNQLLENQITQPEIVLPSDFLQKDIVIRAMRGSWASYSHPNSLDNCLKFIEGCCLGSGIRGCFLAWDYTIRKSDDTVRVNMAFSRNSPWVEVISYQPYQGRLDIIIHNALNIKVIIPSLVLEADIKAAVNNNAIDAQLDKDHYLNAHNLNKGDIVSITYPLRSEVVEERVCDQIYGVKWRGDTVVGIQPTGSTYPLYHREWMEHDCAPLTDHNYTNQTGGPIHW